MNPQIKFKIVTPERTVFEGVIEQATLPVTDGEVTILPNHQNYIASLKAGEIILKIGGKTVSLATTGGFVEFSKNNLIVLADNAERAEEIDIQRAEIAKKRAEEIMKQKARMDDAEYARVAATIEKATARIKVAKKHMTKRGIKID